MSVYLNYSGYLCRLLISCCFKIDAFLLFDIPQYERKTKHCFVDRAFHYLHLSCGTKLSEVKTSFVGIHDPSEIWTIHPSEACRRINLSKVVPSPSRSPHLIVKPVI
jgi:hypothetical protein